MNNLFFLLDQNQSNVLRRSITAILTPMLLSIATFAIAQEQSTDKENKVASKPAIQEVVINAHPLSAEGLAQATVVLSGDDLAQALQTSIGATVAGEPGVRMQSFGEAAGRPIIHGLAGPRVRILEDRIDTLDASVTSTDHAVTIEPFIADHIEIIKGASTLLYGSGAIGGIVDVHTGRIPHNITDKAVVGRVELRAADNGDRTVGMFRLDGTLPADDIALSDKQSVVWHLDGFGRDAGEYDIPDFAESAQLRAEEQAEGGSEADEQQGNLGGSHLRNHGGAAGVSVIGERGFIGLAISSLESDYGLPGGHEEESEGAGESGNPTLALEQVRIDFEAGLVNPFSGFESINFRMAINNYQHTEFEPDGAAGTRFDNEAMEWRAELVHSPILSWAGSFGLQVNERDFAAEGDEAFVEPVNTQSAGIFWVAQQDFSSLGLLDKGLSIEAGIRFEQLSHRPSGEFANDGSCVQSGRLSDKDFDSFSGSLGAIIPLQGGLLENARLRVAVDYANRAPTSEELFACGPHLASQNFQIGDPSLNQEQALNFSATLDYQNTESPLETLFELTVYHIIFDDYIYQAAFDGNNNGLIEASGIFDNVPDGLQDIQDELPVFLNSQAEAEFTGLDLKIGLTLARWADNHLSIAALYDRVKARIDTAVGQQDAPRIPASRYGLGLDWHIENLNFRSGPTSLDANIKFQRVDRQSDIAQFERDTDGYNDLSVYIGMTFEGLDQSTAKRADQQSLTLFLQGRNLTDAEQRNHSSFIKDFAPVPGRTLELGARYSF